MLESQEIIENNIVPVEALKNFLAQVVSVGGQQPEKKYSFGLVDISRPMADDMQALASGNYQISNYRTAQRSDGGVDYHFYIGQTEIHIKGQAADDLTELVSANK